MGHVDPRFPADHEWARLTLVLLGGAWACVSVWLVGRIPVEDLLPISLSGLGLLVALVTTRWSVLEQRRHLTKGFAMALWEKWTDPEMVTSRKTCWDRLQATPFTDGKKQIGHLRATDAVAYEAMAKVNHFLADLHDFTDAGLLDTRDVHAIFRDTLQSYYCHLHFVEICDGLPDSAADAQRIWFKEKVLGLAKQLSLDTEEGFLRYRETFRANQHEATASRSHEAGKK